MIVPNANPQLVLAFWSPRLKQLIRMPILGWNITRKGKTIITAADHPAVWAMLDTVEMIGYRPNDSHDNLGVIEAELIEGDQG